jgi:20S proteasome subunit beta 7
MDPLYNITLVGGFDAKDEPYLGYVDLYGTLIVGDYLTAGLAQYFCRVLLATYAKPTMSEEEAKELLTQCMRVLVYRDARACEEVQFCLVTKRGVDIQKPVLINGNWTLRQFIEDTNEKIRSVKL